MASAAEQPSNIEVFSWLKNLPVAPEYQPTLAEFEDPIGFIFKIENEASKYGICKIVPPVPASPKKTAIANLNKSLAARSSNPNSKSAPTFTTRQQQIGFCPRKHRPVQKPVWQSGETYTLPDFEAKAKSFERNYLKKAAKKALSALEIETLYWKATVDKPFSVEYANDMPGSAFMPLSEKKGRETGEAVTVGETAWNMRGVSREKGSLLRFMKEEIPGVTSPMVYIAMMFSWFAWHVEDHDLHSLNYLHTGAGKTWYGVPREAAVAFEEVIRVHGYGGEINPLVTFATLGEKITVMSPEVLLSAGVPCCRLVQNPGEFVVTFPRAYHSGFSHGFNCGEAANIATPEWLRVAKDAAIRRASINCPPMVSHFQLLYDLALSLCARVPKSISKEPRSSRLKDKKKGEADNLVKKQFVQDLMQNNNLLHILGKGSSVVLLPRYFVDNSACSNLRVGSQLKVKPRFSLGLYSPNDESKDAESLLSDDIVLDRKQGAKHLTGLYSLKENFSSFYDRSRPPLLGRSNDVSCSLASYTQNLDHERTARCDRLSDQGLFSCVTCGILCFACVAIVQPSEASACYLMSADCSIFNNWAASSDGLTAVDGDANSSVLNSSSGCMFKSTRDGLFEVPIQSADKIQTVGESMGVVSNTEAQQDNSSLGLLAFTYGNSSDSEEDMIEADIPVNGNEPELREYSAESRLDCGKTGLASLERYSGATGCNNLPFSQLGCRDEVPLQIIDPHGEHVHAGASFKDRTNQSFGCPVEFEMDDITSLEASSLRARFRHQMKLSPIASSCSPVAHKAETSINSAKVPIDNTIMSCAPRSDQDSARMHVFCLQHAVEVEQQLCSIGGAHILLLCHPDYPKLEAKAKLVAEELGTNHLWSDIAFREATEEDDESIQSALDSEAAVHGNGDWAVKLGINLYYSANLSCSPLYSKQMPYNSVIYSAFGRSSQVDISMKPEFCGKGSGKHKKIVVAGKWCGKVWMSNQVHPLLAERDDEDQEQERSIPARAKPDMKLERITETTHIAETASATSKIGRNRKNRVESRSIMKIKVQKDEDPDQSSDETPEDSSHQQHKKNLRNKRMKTDTTQPRSNSGENTRLMDTYDEDELEGGPSRRLRKRLPKPTKELGVKRVGSKPVDAKPVLKQQLGLKKGKKAPAIKVLAGTNGKRMRDVEAEYPCDMEGCTMSFGSKQELVLHKRNICPVKGCGKKFFSHKYLVQHRRVHMDDRPLKCPWKGCKMTFKWAWARTEHIRVHTGARPYVCTEAGCGQTFRFVSDFSRHKRKTGHSPKKGRG
ncbi:unnamed protein product [Ilex paraguariensis]|uniref:Lysine-specific demethylase REF6 n=1 Tax=Ilex paraguariensis TaxID=185542 RepID=A0ABC8TTY9_9AQUA